MYNEAIIAALIAIVVSFAKIVEMCIGWFVGKFKKKEGTNGHNIHLDPETCRILRDIYEKSHDLFNVIGVKDSDGVPMVYSSRSNNENVQQIALILRDVVNTQERIVTCLDRMNEKVSKIEYDVSKLIDVIEEHN